MHFFYFWKEIYNYIILYHIYIYHFYAQSHRENIASIEKKRKRTFIVRQLITAAPTPNVNLMSKGNTPLGLT